MGSLIMGSDSRVVLAWAKSYYPWHSRFFGNNLKNMLWILKNVSVTHRNRESNHLADSLAKEGASLQGSWVKWFE